MFSRNGVLVLTAAGLVAEDAVEEEALEALGKQGWGMLPKTLDDDILLGEYSFLLMKALDIPGGLMYLIFPGPRYASRELNYRSITIGKNNPYKILSGEEIVGILGRALGWVEANL